MRSPLRILISLVAVVACLFFALVVFFSANKRWETGRKVKDLAKEAPGLEFPPKHRRLSQPDQPCDYVDTSIGRVCLPSSLALMEELGTATKYLCTGGQVLTIYNPTEFQTVTDLFERQQTGKGHIASYLGRNPHSPAELMQAIMAATPDQYRPMMSAPQAKGLIELLTLKGVLLSGSSGGCIRFEKGGAVAFQIGEPVLDGKVKIVLFTRKGEITVAANGNVTQEDIDAMVSCLLTGSKESNPKEFGGQGTSTQSPDESQP